jgi:hypothetical protein
MMRDETRQKLDRILFQQKLKRIALGLAGFAAFGTALWFKGLDATVENVRVTGVVEKIEPLRSGTASDLAKGLDVDVRLDDGRKVHVMALKTTDPHVGEHVLVTEHRHGTGRLTYTWR